GSPMLTIEESSVVMNMPVHTSTTTAFACTLVCPAGTTNVPATVSELVMSPGIVTSYVSNIGVPIQCVRMARYSAAGRWTIPTCRLPADSQMACGSIIMYGY